jgi:hypothetical protein
MSAGVEKSFLEAARFCERAIEQVIRADRESACLSSRTYVVSALCARLLNFGVRRAGVEWVLQKRLSDDRLI